MKRYGLIALIVILIVSAILILKKRIMNLNNKITEKALSYIGLKEITGANHNPEILNFFKEIGFNIPDDETSWCAAFANFVLKKSGAIWLKTLSAREMLKLPNPVTTPQKGDIAVFWRTSPSSWKGHVGFYISETTTHIKILGGNQNNSVSYLNMPKGRLLGYRRAIKS